MLITALKNRFTIYLQQDPTNDTILWFDAGRDYRELLQPLQGAGVPLRLVQSAGELIRIRAELIYRQPGEKVVVYLPWAQYDPTVDILIPNIPVAEVFSDSLFRFLSHLDVVFPEDPQTKNAIKDVLPQLAGESIGKGRGFWNQVLSSLDAVREALLGDFEEILLRFLALPDEELVQMQSKGIEQFFFGLLESRYGFRVDTSQSPETISRQMSMHLMATRAYVTTSQPEDFPFPKLLPEKHLFEKCEAFLRRWQDSSYKVAYKKLAAQLEGRYSLVSWLAGLPLETALQMGPTFVNLEDALWGRIEQKLNNLANQSEWLAFASAYQAGLAERSDNFWAQEGQAAQWQIATRAMDLLTATQNVNQTLDQVLTAEALIQKYVEIWWQVDRGYRELLEAISEAIGSYDQLRKHADRAYHDYLSKLNVRFTDLIGTRATWEFAGFSKQSTTWNDLVTVSDKKRTAVIFVDALRYELAQALSDRLKRDIPANDILTQARIVSLPAITKIGMPALLPDGHQMKVGYDQDWQVNIGDSGNLADKSAREDYLRSKFDRIQIYTEISELLSTPVDQIPATANLYVTFHTALDNIGENAQELALTAFSEIIKQVEQAIRKFRGAGIREIHVLTDHGFMLLNTVGEETKVPVKNVPAFKKGSRYLVGENLGQTDQISFIIPGSDKLEAWFPCGVGVFKTPGKYNYAHGGVSIQEIVIPCLTVKQEEIGDIIDVEIQAPAEIRQKLEKVKIIPKAATVFGKAREIELVLQKGDHRIITLQQVISPAEENEITVLFSEDALLEVGDKVRWLLLDRITGQLLDEQEAVNFVDFF